MALLDDDAARRAGSSRSPGAVANFVLVRVGAEADALAAALRARGVIVQPGAPFGAPESLRITAGSAGGDRGAR